MFLLKKVLTALLMPPMVCVLLALLGLWIARRHRRTGTALTLASLLSLLVLSTPLVADGLLKGLQSAGPATPQALAPAQAIVVLGGGAYTLAPEYGLDALSRGARERVRYAAHLQRMTGLPLLATGGAPDGTRPEAVIMKEVIERELRGRVRWVESESLDTASNARRSAPLLKAAGVRRVALVTHGWHMRRAAWWFEREGLEVIPAPMGLRPPRPQGWTAVLPRAASLADSSLALHEWLGILAQRLGALRERLR
ncbi:YdcF family protein [Acidovorax lacteus]|uniref:YdcF family protein n=1 Tax=Acidovorax lacteus TaxID=1924988 RepID=A0ABP8LEE9_9BURK